MRRAWVLALALFATPLFGQQPRRDQVIQQITERFMENFRQQAGLTPDQYQRFRVVAMRSFEQRRDRQQKEQELFRSLEMQMRPGVAANPDSVSRILDAILSVRASAVDQARADLKDYATFLTPVQRGQLFLQFERLQRNVEDVVQRRMQRAGMQAGPPPQE